MTTLKKRSAIAFAWDLGGTFMRKGCGFVISIFLARLLDPAEFGLVGMAMVFISISQVFIDVGFSSALIQSKGNTNLTYSSVFYLNVFAGVILTTIFYLVAPLVGSFYENHQITDLVQWLSLIFVFNSLNLVQQAILQRKLNFKILTLRTVVATTVGGGIGVVFAFQGYGVYSLVIQQLCTAVLSTILLWSTSGWMPDLKFSRLEIKKLTSFSAFVFFDRFTSVFFQKLDTLFIGKAFSAATLGFYTRAESLNSQVTVYTSSSLNKVFFPVLSGLQEDEKKFNSIYFKLVSLICFVSFLISGLLYVLADPIIIGLFGPKWEFSIIIFQILVFKSFNVPLNAMMLNALLSRGKSKENFIIGLLRKTLRATPIIIGILYGLIPFVFGVTIISYFLTLLNIIFIKKYLKINVWYHLKKVFEGGLPFFVLTVLYNYISHDSLLDKIIISLLFVLFYIFYAKKIKMEGFGLVTTEINKLLKKINWR